MVELVEVRKHVRPRLSLCTQRWAQFQLGRLDIVGVVDEHNQKRTITPCRARNKLCQSRHSRTKGLSPHAGSAFLLPLILYEVRTWPSSGVVQCLPERRSHHSLKPNSWRPLFALLRLPLFLLRVLPPLTTLPSLAALPLLHLVHHLPLLDVRKRVALLAHLQAAPRQTARPERLKAASPNCSLPPQRGRAASKFSHMRWQT